MKRIFFTAIVFVQLIFVGTVAAATVSVDFNALGFSSVDITSPNSLTLNGITFRYDDQGQAGNTARANLFGLHGSTVGALIFDFATPASALDFKFAVKGVQGSEPVTDSLIALYASGGNFIDVQSITSGVPFVGLSFGNLDYANALTFDEAVFYFTLDAAKFCVWDISYQTPSPGTAVPLPATIWLLGTGLAGMAVLKRRLGI